MIILVIAICMIFLVVALLVLTVAYAINCYNPNDYLSCNSKEYECEFCGLYGERAWNEDHP